MYNYCRITTYIFWTNLHSLYLYSLSFNYVTYLFETISWHVLSENRKLLYSNGADWSVNLILSVSKHIEAASSFLTLLLWNSCFCIFSVINLETPFLKALSPFFHMGALVQLLRGTPQAEQSSFIYSQHRQEGCSGLANSGTDSLRMHSNISHLSSWLTACQTVCWPRRVTEK